MPRRDNRSYYYRLRSAERRLRRLTALAAATAIAVIIGLGTYYWSLNRSLIPHDTTATSYDHPSTSTPDEGQIGDTSAVSVTVDTIKETSTLGAIIDCDLCPAIIVIPKGRFLMGLGPHEARDDAVPPVLYGQFEGPQHGVTIKKPIGIAKTEITVEQFAKFATATGFEGEGCQTLNWADGSWIFDAEASWETPGFDQKLQHPVVCISYDDAQRYVQWLSSLTGEEYRLPTEVEWEYAARAHTQTSRYWGQSPAQACAYTNSADLTAGLSHRWRRDFALFPCYDKAVFTSPVGFLTPNHFGIHDMLGNAEELTDDCWSENYREDRPDKDHAHQAPACPSIVLRGGSWNDGPLATRASRRGPIERSLRRNTVGFRVVRKVGYAAAD